MSKRIVAIYLVGLVVAAVLGLVMWVGFIKWAVAL